MRSYRVVAEGGIDFWDDLKAKSQGIVRILTDDTQIDHAVLLRSGDNEVRVGTYTPTRPADLETQELGRRHRAQVLSIAKHRIRQMTTLS